MRTILGLSAYYHDAAAALLVDGRIVAAAQEERFSRIKHDAAFPAQAIAWCLREAGLRIEDLDLVAFYEKPLLKLDRLLETYFATAPASLRSFLRSMPLWLKQKAHVGRELGRGLGPAYTRRFVFPEHHLSHAASAFLPSPFEEAAILTLDGVGEWATASVGRGRGNRVELLDELRFPHSLGLLYSAFTVLTGFEVNDGEYKLMGLAPYGEPRFKDLILERLIDLKADGSFRLDMRWFGYAHGLTMTTPRLHRLLGRGPRRKDEPLTALDMDLAASIQAVTEEVMVRAARHALQRAGSKRLCLAGGVALNCVGNGRILREAGVEDLWIQPAAGDAGGALGAALWTWHGLLDKPRTALASDAQQGSRLGPAFGSDEVRALLEREGARYERCADEGALCAQVAGLLAEGKVVGWFQGRLEYGPRALGGRSILADPRSPEMQSRVNQMVKFRESFRPFAPAVLAEQADDWFDLDGHASPYMLLVAPVAASRRVAPTEEERALQGLARLGARRSSVPAVTHVDGSARIQTVDRAREPRFHALLTAFERLTGCPVLINTSFNVKDEPIVATPQDAWRTYLATGIDVLVLEDCVVRVKPAQGAVARAATRAATTDVLEGAPPRDLPPAPTPSALALFVATPLLLLGVVAGLLRWRAGLTTLPPVLLVLGALASLTLLLAPGLRHPAHDAWGRVVRPVGRLLTALLLGAIYLLVLTPLALLARLLGRDPLQRRLDRGASSYWRPRSRVSDVDDAFRAS